MELAVIGILIVLVVLVTCLLHNANSRAKKWEHKCRAIDDEYRQIRDTNRANEMEVNRLYKMVGDLRWKISSLEEKLELERRYNKKSTGSYIKKNNGWKEEIKNLKKSKPISRSKAVQYITQHSNFTPTQMNNQSTDNLLDYYWYLYLMNTTITEDSKSSTNSDDNTVSDKTEFVRVEGILYDSNKVNQNMNNYTVSDGHGQITSIPNSVYAEKLFNDGKTTGNHDESSKSSDSSSSDDSCGSSSSHYSGSSFSSSGSSSSGWGSSNHSSSSSYDSGSSDSWSSSDSSSCDSGGGDW